MILLHYELNYGMFAARMLMGLHCLPGLTCVVQEGIYIYVAHLVSLCAACAGAVLEDCFVLSLYISPINVYNHCKNG